MWVKDLLTERVILRSIVKYSLIIVQQLFIQLWSQGLWCHNQRTRCEKSLQAILRYGVKPITSIADLLAVFRGPLITCVRTDSSGLTDAQREFCA